MLRLFYLFLLVFTFIISSGRALAWEDHAILTKIVLDDWLAKDAAISERLNQTVNVESLKSFLNDTAASLPAKMLEIEAWARKNEAGYRPLPDKLSYQALRADCASDLELCFKKALRINLDLPTQPIVYDPSFYYTHQRKFLRATDLHQLVPSYVSVNYNPRNFAVIPGNGRVRVADLIATGAIQPDFGMDIYLYEDDPTTFGKIYGFGTQPTGSPAYPLSSQVLFHVGTYRDDPKILAVLPRLNESYPEYRAYLYLSLSRFAAENKHPYWAAIFLGWGLHYIQDMTQPYHSKIAYGLETNAVLSALAELGKKNYQPFTELQTLQANRHSILENLTNIILSSSLEDSLYQKILYHGLVDRHSSAKLLSCDVNGLLLRKQITPVIADLKPDYQSILQGVVPSLYINQPLFHAETITNYEKLFSQEMTKAQRLSFSQAIVQPLYLFGAYTRSCIERS
jgi:hypothetical protein